MEDNLVNNEHNTAYIPGPYIACAMHVNYTDNSSNPTYSHELPQELVNLGITTDLWHQFINEANEELKFRWGPNIILSLFLCCIPIFCCNQYNKDIAHRMEIFCEKWNSSGRLPNGVSIRYDIQIKKFHIGGGDVVRATDLDTWHNLFFMANSNA